MKIINTLFLLFFIGLAISCSTIYGLHYDFDINANFENLKTYDWMPTPEKSYINRLDIRRVKKATNAELKANGVMMISDNPDFLIAVHLRKKDKVRIVNWRYDNGPHRGDRGGYWGHRRYWEDDRGPMGVSTYHHEELSLILEFVNAKSKKIFWRGVAKTELDNVNTSKEREKLINGAVKQILKNYPPQPKK
jgi:hypothetical protein